MATDSDQAQAFAARLRDAMKAKGLTSDRNRSGVDVSALARGVGVSYEMARRYVEGAALPRPDVLARISAWLNVDGADLVWGENRVVAGVDPALLERALRAVRDAQLAAGVSLDEDHVARIVAQLYGEIARGEVIQSSALAVILRAMRKS